MVDANGIQLNGTGGRYLEIPLAYARNETVTSLDRGDTISISDTKFLTVCQFEWKFVAGSIVRYYTDDAKNKSKQQHLNLANSKIDNLEKSMIDKFENFLFGDGTGNGSKDPDGFGNIIAAAPTTGSGSVMCPIAWTFGRASWPTTGFRPPAPTGSFTRRRMKPRAGISWPMPWSVKATPPTLILL